MASFTHCILWSFIYRSSTHSLIIGFGIRDATQIELLFSSPLNPNKLLPFWLELNPPILPLDINCHESFLDSPMVTIEQYVFFIYSTKNFVFMQELCCASFKYFWVYRPERLSSCSANGNLEQSVGSAGLFLPEDLGQCSAALPKKTDGYQWIRTFGIWIINRYIKWPIRGIVLLNQVLVFRDGDELPGVSPP